MILLQPDIRIGCNNVWNDTVENALKRLGTLI